MMIVTETQRLRLRHFHTGDAAFILHLLNTPGWLQFIGDRRISTLSNAENYIINGPVKSYEKLGFGLYLVSLKSDDTSIGMCGLIKRDVLEDVDLGFAFLPEHGGKGYAAEAAAAIVAYAKTVLKLERLSAITLPNNTSSIRLLEKTGMHFEKNIQLPGETETLMLFTITL